jgi:nitroreductase
MKVSPILQILDLARWAPSGDNTQPWRFEVVDEHHVVIHGHDTRSHCVYDLDGHPSQMSIGALIENAAIAATAHGLGMTASRRPDTAETEPTFDLRFHADPALQRSPLVPFIPWRSVQRRPLSRRPLTQVESTALAASVGNGYQVLWLASAADRRRAAWLLYASAELRLTMPEAYEVHRAIIQWGARFSVDRVPSQALGADALSVQFMRFGMRSWDRIRWLNRFAAGTVLPRLQLDLLPRLCCAAHYAIVADRPPVTIDDHVAAGRAMQRFWLTATQLGLQAQPEVTPLVFARYARTGRQFTSVPGRMELATRIERRLDALLSGQSARAVWFGRVGAGERAQARSERLPLSALLGPGPRRPG